MDKPFILSKDPDSKACVSIYTENGYFVHRNKGDEGHCTDIMLAFGDVEPGKIVETSGYVRIEESFSDDIIH